MDELRIERSPSGVRFTVRVAPRASRTRVLGVYEGGLKIALTAAPVDGEANAALVAWLAKRLGVAQRSVTIERGQTSRVKVVHVTGLDMEAEKVRASLVRAPHA